MVKRSLPTHHHYCEFLAQIWGKDPKTVFHGAFRNLRYNAMKKSKLITLAAVFLVVSSFVANVVLGVQLYGANKKIQALEETVRLNKSVLNFADLFISKVLKATSEISFEDRLQIENAVRDTKDQDIYDQWQKFVASQTLAEGQEEVKNILQLITRKLSS